MLLAVLVAVAVWCWVSVHSLAPLLLIPLAAVIGPVVGLASTAGYFTWTFKAALAGGLIAAGGVGVVGWRNRARLWGQGLVVVGVMAWVVCGLVGFGPQ